MLSVTGCKSTFISVEASTDINFLASQDHDSLAYIYNTQTLRCNRLLCNSPSSRFFATIEASLPNKWALPSTITTYNIPSNPFQEYDNKTHLLEPHCCLSFYVETMCFVLHYACARIFKMALVGKVQKKRAWGKSAERKKITVIENMNLHVPDEPKTTSKVMEDGKNSLQSEKDSEWMHPEILPTERLKEILTDMKVPMAMDGATDRDDLVRLFRKHLLPRPQRKRYKRETRQKAWGLQETAAKAGNEMEWDDSCCTDALAMAAIDSIRLESNIDK